MSASIGSVRGLFALLARPRRLLTLVAGFVGFVLYLWYTAVRAVPNVKRRKAALRRARADVWRSWKA
jgi:hypothetical protein